MTVLQAFESPLEREELCSLLIARVRDYAIFMVSPDGKVMSWNDGARLIKGYARDEIVGQPISIFYTPEDNARGQPDALLQEAAAKGRVQAEGWRVRKDGSRFWADVVITALRDSAGQLTGYAKVTRDLTERRRTEAAMEELSGRLFLLQDEERKRFGAQLHDQTSTSIASALTKLYRVRAAVGDNRVAQDDINEAIRDVEEVGDVIRRVAHMLHPSRLERGGLVDTLRWYVKALSEQMGLAVKADLPETPVKLSKEGEIVLFRLVQECLSRMLGPHSAQQATVHLSADGDATIQISIEGAVRGGQLETEQRRRGDIGMGFAGLRERLRRLGGTLKVTSGGTTSVVEATVPVSG
ncbi:MAG TPA: PAS domain S-box protein [Gemmatimonadales bacterium]|nr:PAS domain S-box protein [Gemmatimonadales bacterium]